MLYQCQFTFGIHRIYGGSGFLLQLLRVETHFKGVDTVKDRRRIKDLVPQSRKKAFQFNLCKTGRACAELREDWVMS
jgi:hypothetical protein